MYTVYEEVIHSDFTPLGAYWLNHIPLDTILLSTVPAFTSMLGNTEGVKECQSLPWYVKSNITTLRGQKMTQTCSNTQLCVIKLLLFADKPTPYFCALNMVLKSRLICEYIRQT